MKSMYKNADWIKIAVITLASGAVHQGSMEVKKQVEGIKMKSSLFGLDMSGVDASSFIWPKTNAFIMATLFHLTSKDKTSFPSIRDSATGLVAGVLASSVYSTVKGGQKLTASNVKKNLGDMQNGEIPIDENSFLVYGKKKQGSKNG